MTQYKLTIHNVDGTVKTAELGSPVEVQKVLRQYDHEGAGIYLDIFISGEDVYMMLDTLIGED